MAATGTPTPNLGLRRAQGTDPASVDDINYNSELLDTKLGAVGGTSVQGQIDALSASTAQTFGNVQDGLAIVSNGNTHVAIPAGYWVYVKGHGTLSEGLYKNTSGATIAANATLSTSNLTADPDGGLNSVYNALNSNLTHDIDVNNVWVESGIYDETKTWTNNTGKTAWVRLQSNLYANGENVVVKIDGVVIIKRIQKLTNMSFEYWDIFPIPNGAVLTIEYGATGFAGVYTIYKSK